MRRPHTCWLSVLCLTVVLAACNPFASADAEPPVAAEPAPIPTPAPTSPPPAPTAAPTATAVRTATAASTSTTAPTATALPPTATWALTTATRPPATATTRPAPATPQPTATTFASVTVRVGNTGGDGVYLRKTRDLSDHLAAYPDGTALLVLGPDSQQDGLTWKHVRALDGTEGYVPAQYTVPDALQQPTGSAPNPTPLASPTVDREQVAAAIRTYAARVGALQAEYGQTLTNLGDLLAQAPGTPPFLSGLWKGQVAVELLNLRLIAAGLAKLPSVPFTHQAFAATWREIATEHAALDDAFFEARETLTEAAATALLQQPTAHVRTLVATAEAQYDAAEETFLALSTPAPSTTTVP